VFSLVLFLVLVWIFSVGVSFASGIGCGVWVFPVKFTVSSVDSTNNGDDGDVVHAPELPNIGYVLGLLALASVALLRVSRRRR